MPGEMMKPVVQNLAVVPGTTYRDTIRLMQPVWEYRPITSITGAPVVLAVAGHGLVDHWPVWVRGVTGMPALNREPPQARPLRATVVDPDTLEINELSAAGFIARGGELVYQRPVDLVGAVPRMNITGAVDLVLELGAGLELTAPGTIVRTLTDEQTASLGADWTYTFDVEFSDGSVIRFFEGGPDTGGGRLWIARPRSKSWLCSSTNRSLQPPSASRARQVVMASVPAVSLTSRTMSQQALWRVRPGGTL